MRIALFHNLPSGGAKRAVFEMVRRITERHEVHGYSLSSANHEFCDLRPILENHRVFPFEPLSQFGSPFGRLNQFQRWRDLGRLIEINRRIAREIDKQTYDLVFVHPCRWSQAPPLLNFLKTPSVYYVQEPLRISHEATSVRPYLNRSWRAKVDAVDPLIRLYSGRLTRLDQANTKRATYVLANSQFTAENIRRIYGRQGQVAYLGVDTQRFKPILKTHSHPFVLSVGAIQPKKGFDFLIKALSCIPRGIRPALRILGNATDAREQRYLENLAQRVDVDLKIETEVSEESLLQKYSQAIVFLYAPVREPFGLAPLEAMACGAPVIAVAEGGVKETVVDGLNGFLVSRDPLEFAESVKMLLQNPELQRRLSVQSRDYVTRNWNWDRSAHAIESCLENFIRCSSLRRKVDDPGNQKILGPEVREESRDSEHKTARLCS